MARPSRQDNCRIAIHGGRKKPMSCSDDQPTGADALDTLDDAVAAAAFRRLVRLLQHRHDAANIDLMGLAGFCRNCLGDWIAEAGGLDKEVARAIVHGMPTAEWKARFHVAATPEQHARMAESMAKNPRPREGVAEASLRSEERRVGKECVSRCKTRWSL